MLDLYLSSATPVAECDFSVRSYNILMRAGIDTVGKLSALSVNELLKVRNMTQRSAAEILGWLTQSVVYVATEPEAVTDEPAPFVLVLVRVE